MCDWRLRIEEVRWREGGRRGRRRRRGLVNIICMEVVWVVVCSHRGTIPVGTTVVVWEEVCNHRTMPIHNRPSRTITTPCSTTTNNYATRSETLPKLDLV